MLLGSFEVHHRIDHRDGQGNLYLSGSYETQQVDGLDRTLYKKGDRDLFLAKFDVKGEMIWIKTIGTRPDYVQHDYYPSSIDVDESGNIFLACSYKGKVIVGEKPYELEFESNSTETYLTKFNADGQPLWIKSLAEYNARTTRSIANDGEGGFYVAGTSSGYRRAARILRTDANGNLLWAQNIGDNMTFYNGKISVGPTGDIFVLGGFNASGSEEQKLVFGVGEINEATFYVNRGYFMFSYDKDGNFLWAKAIETEPDDFRNHPSLYIDENSDIYVSAILRATTSFLWGQQRVKHSDTGTTTVVAKYDELGSLVWVNSLSNNYSGYSLIPYHNANNIINASFSNSYIELAAFKPGSETINSIFKIDKSAGSIVSVRNIISGSQMDGNSRTQRGEIRNIYRNKNETRHLVLGNIRTYQDGISLTVNGVDYDAPPGTFTTFAAKINSNYCVSQTYQSLCFRWTEPPTVTVADGFTVFTGEPKTCAEVQTNYVRQRIDDQKETLLSRKEGVVQEAYRQQCAAVENVNDQLTLTYPLGYHHYTLYYYDRGGNLIKTVPPAGVRADGSNQHTLVTSYDYNSLGQLVGQQTPDAGSTQFYYNAIGQLRFSQNAQQQLDGSYSYTKYDGLGRVVEVGESQEAAATFAQQRNDSDFPGSGTQCTVTVYNQPAPVRYLDDATYTRLRNQGWEGLPKVRSQRYLQNRVSYSYLDEDGSDATTNDRHYTYYSYDAHGNVAWLVQDVPGLAKKHLRYAYDLLSGNVRSVYYQEGQADAFYHQYEYDADNRLHRVRTSTDGHRWEQDASYDYYAHGPLRRVVLGHDQVQGVDYTYTVHGWLKAINHPLLGADPGQDGKANDATARDAFGMALGYYAGDYKNNRNRFQRITDNTDALITRPLYNGNVAAWSSNVQESQVYIDQGKPKYRGLTGQQFGYDELNRLVSNDMQRYRAQSWQPTNHAGEYSSSYSYDASGNLQTLVRNAYGKNPLIDRLQYHYLPNSNKLDYVSDAADHFAIKDDFRPGQQAGNYAYDAIGNLTQDEQEGITNIDWTVYGKVQQVTKTDGSTVRYRYDASGNRTGKEVTNADNQVQQTYYVRDASGNVMAIYQGEPAAIKLSEQPIYGSDRIGMYRPAAEVVAPTEPVVDSDGVAYITEDLSINKFENIYDYVLAEGVEMTVAQDFSYSYADKQQEFSISFGDIESEGKYYARVLGQKQYELKDHLGNVRVVVSDRKLLEDRNKDGEPEVRAEVLASYNYYPFGMQQPGRTYEGSAEYRFGFNGKEKDNSLGSTVYDYGFRIYNPQIAKFLSVDPLTSSYPWYTPYQFAGNSPVYNIDVDGLENSGYFWGELQKLVYGSGPSVKVSGTAQKLERQAQARRVASERKEFAAYRQRLASEASNFTSVSAQPDALSVSKSQFLKGKAVPTSGSSSESGVNGTSGLATLALDGTVGGLGILAEGVTPNNSQVRVPTGFEGFILTGVKAGEGGRIKPSSVRYKSSSPTEAFRYKATSTGGTSQLLLGAKTMVSVAGYGLAAYNIDNNIELYQAGEIDNWQFVLRQTATSAGLIPVFGPVIGAGGIMAEEGIKQVGQATGKMEYSLQTKPYGFFNWINGTNSSFKK